MKFKTLKRFLLPDQGESPGCYAVNSDYVIFVPHGDEWRRLILVQEMFVETRNEKAYCFIFEGSDVLPKITTNPNTPVRIFERNHRWS